MIQNILKLEPNKISTDLTSYNFLLYAPPGIGKTTFATLMFPERSLILGFEYGFKGIPKAIGVAIPDYPSAIDYVEQLDTDEARAMYDTLIIDTTTKVGEIIENYILSIYGKNSLGECKSHGAAYPLINRYYNLAFNRLKARGYNFVYICHSKSIEIKDEDGNTIGERFIPKMSDRIAGLIEPEVDYTFFLTQDKDGKRIIVTDNNPKSIGKTRTPLPLVMPLDIDLFLTEFKKGAEEKAKGFITKEKVETTAINFKKKERNYKEVVEEIKATGKKLIEKNRNNEAFAIVNNILGKDDNNVQRTLDDCTQNNIEALETILNELNKIS